MRTRTMTSIDAEIARIQDLLRKTQARYDALTEELKALFNERDEMMAKSLMEQFRKSGKSYDELMKFLSPNG